MPPEMERVLEAEPPLVSCERVSVLTGGLSIRTIHRRIADGTLVPVRFGRRVMITRESLRAFIVAGLGC